MSLFDQNNDDDNNDQAATEETSVAVEVEEEPLGFSYYTTLSGDVVYIADTPESLNAIAEDAKSNSLDVYYIVGLHKPENKTSAPAIFKVTDNLVSRSLQVCDPAALQLINVPATSYFQLPKIPWEMMEKIETFFRRVDKDLQGSEAIIVLGYDTRYSDADGWCIIVPKQSNSAAHCNYEALSVNEFIPDEDIDHVQQVGTIHSHPGMSAFASHTDESDQLTFDGLHITIGWKGFQTEFYAEIQSGGVSYKADPQFVIDIPDKLKKDYPEFNEWLDRVTKKPVGELPKAQTPPASTWSPQIPASGGGSGNTLLEGLSTPAGCPDPRKYIVVANLLNGTERVCPVCRGSLVQDELDNRKCRRCLSFVAMKGETLKDIVKIREAKDKPVYELSAETATRPIAYWMRENINNSRIDYIQPQHKPDVSPKVPGSQRKEASPYA